MADSRLELLRNYFSLGLKHDEICWILNHKHGFSLSSRQLIRILHREGLYRYKHGPDVMDVVDFIQSEHNGSGIMHGYRWMYQKMKSHGINARKEEVRILMGILDPEGTELRRKHKLRRRLYCSKGPNYIWHFDSYDKLRPYGICINGCLDGFSRKIIWLNAYHTSSDPRVIGGYYLKALQKLGSCPLIVRGDRGTENGHVCQFQRFLRRNGNDSFHGKRSFMYGRSTSNQRIESWWGFLRRECMEFWLALFDQIKTDGNFDGGFLDKNLILFCFLPLIQNELDVTAEVWDSHVIRPSSNPLVPSGRPNIMFAVPELYAADDYSCVVDDNDLLLCKNNALFRSEKPCDEDVYDICILLMSENGFALADDAYQAVDLYTSLRQCIHDILI